MPSLKMQILCAVFGLGGVGAAIALPVFMTRGGQKPQQEVSSRVGQESQSQQRTTVQSPQQALKWPEDYVRECYKILINRKSGEFIACSGRKKVWETSPLFFLWWVADEANAKTFAVNKIKVESGGKVSFFSKKDGKVINIGDSEAKLNNGQKLTSLSEKSLKDQKCQIQGDELKCTDGNVKLEENRASSFYI